MTRKRFVFIGGIERSGTTVLATALARRVSGVAIPEAQFKRDLIGRSEVGPVDIRALNRSFRFRLWDLPRKCYDLEQASGPALFEKIVDHLLHRHGLQDRSLIFDHTPENFGHVPLLLDAFPGSQLIHLVRDPRAVINSLMDTDWNMPALGDAIAYWKSRNEMAEKAILVAENDIALSPYSMRHSASPLMSALIG